MDDSTRQSQDSSEEGRQPANVPVDSGENTFHTYKNIRHTFENIFHLFTNILLIFTNFVCFFTNFSNLKAFPQSQTFFVLKTLFSTFKNTFYTLINVMHSFATTLKLCGLAQDDNRQLNKRNVIKILTISLCHLLERCV